MNVYSEDELIEVENCVEPKEDQEREGKLDLILEKLDLILEGLNSDS